jgi:uncharacterized protein YlxW (UPF0749 family)
MDNKQTYLSRMAGQLQNWDQELQQLKVKAEHVKQEKKQDIKDSIAGLNAKRADLNNRIEILRNSSSSAWEDLKNGFDKSVSEFRKSLDTAMQKLK